MIHVKRAMCGVPNLVTRSLGDSPLKTAQCGSVQCKRGRGASFFPPMLFSLVFSLMATGSPTCPFIMHHVSWEYVTKHMEQNEWVNSPPGSHFH